MGGCSDSHLASGQMGPVLPAEVLSATATSQGFRWVSGPQPLCTRCLPVSGKRSCLLWRGGGGSVGGRLQVRSPVWVRTGGTHPIFSHSRMFLSLSPFLAL